MKSISPILFILALAGVFLTQTVFSDTSSRSDRETGGPTRAASFDGLNKAEALAESYVVAFDSLSGMHKTLILKFGDNLKRIEDIRSVSRIQSVLVVKNKKLKSFVVNAEDVLFFTNDSSVVEYR